ncbi:MAG: hypothetical protein M1305_07230 [Candidatus Marsarchaeota archaeon]|nr:hypothetical protein [Candidatus Marsarchaeota archaeon]
MVEFPNVIVEGSNIVVLVMYGSSRVPTLAAVLAYGVIAFWLAIPAGWAAFAAIAIAWRRSNRSASNRLSAISEQNEL